MAKLGQMNMGEVDVLLVGSTAEDRGQLSEILERSRFRLFTVASAQEALPWLQTVRFPVVLWDSEVAGSEWKRALHWLAGFPNRPAVLLVSLVADHYLWEEVVRSGGFDILPRPFRRDRTLAALGFAYRYWESGGTQLRSA